MEAGILVLTQKGREALKNAPQDMTSLCRNILVQIDGKKTVEEVFVLFRGLKGLDDSMQKLFNGNFVQVSRECKDLVKNAAQNLLGPKAPTFLLKIDDMHAKYGSACWEHLDELDKTARLFYGEVIANNLKSEIAKIISGLKK